MQTVFRIFMILLLGGLSACGPNSSPPGPNRVEKERAAPARVFYVAGSVREVHLNEKSVVVEHEAIAGFMEAMTMPFNIANTNEFVGISTNDRVHFRLVVETGRSWIDQVTKVGEAVSLAEVGRKDFRLVRDVEPLEVGDFLPAYPLTNQVGKAFTTSDFKGEVLVLTLIFTRCPLPDFCPRMSQNFKRIHQLLKADAEAPKNWQLLSVSFDPEFDTPDVLSAYARQHGSESKDWTFATGALLEIDDLTERLGMYFARENGGVSFNHNLRTVVIDPTGQVRQIYIGNTWQPEEVVALVKKTAAESAAVMKSER